MNKDLENNLFKTDLLDRIKRFRRPKIYHDPHDSFNYEASKLVFNEEVGFVILSQSLNKTIARNKAVIQNIITDIKNGSEEYKLYFTENCDVVNENGEDILSKVVVSNEIPFNVTMNKQILSVDETFDVLAELRLLVPEVDLQTVVNILSNCYVQSPLIPLFWKACRDGQFLKKPLYEGCPSYKTVVETAIIPLDISDNTNFHYLLLYVERNTNLILLRPLKTTVCEEVAYELLNIFCDFGLPHFLDCPNRLLFKRVLEALYLLKPPFPVPILYSAFPEHKISTMSSKTTQMLNDWMTRSNSWNWGIGAHIVQWIMNSNEVHETCITSKFSQGSLYSPYRVMFGEVPHTDLIELSVQNDENSPTEQSKKDLTICSQCDRPVYKKYICHYCLDVFHITCCDRMIQEGGDVPILINKCFSCVPESIENDEGIMPDNPDLNPSSDAKPPLQLLGLPDIQNAAVDDV